MTANASEIAYNSALKMLAVFMSLVVFLVLLQTTGSSVKLTESWLTANDTNGLLDPEGEYVIVRWDRRCNVGGGVCVTIQRSLTCTEVRYEDADGVEMLCVDVLRDLSFNSFY